MSRPCSVCRCYSHRVYCTPALRSLVKAAEKWEQSEWSGVPTIAIGGEWRNDIPLVRAVRRWQKERAR